MKIPQIKDFINMPDEEVEKNLKEQYGDKYPEYLKKKEEALVRLGKTLKEIANPDISN